MKIGVISDIHENFHNLIRALEKMQELNVEYIICLGDLMNAGIAKILAWQPVDTYLIWGNNDGEKVDVVKASYRENSSLTVSLNTYDFLNLDGKKIFISHYDDLAEPMAQSGNYDAVFYGHNHKMKLEYINDIPVVNPGELSAQKSGVASLAIYDTDKDKVELVELEDIISLKSDYVDAFFKKNMESLGFRSKDSFK